jgi:hypothetical protein
MEQDSAPAQTTSDASRSRRRHRIVAVAFSMVVLIALLLVLRSKYSVPQSPVVGIWRQFQEQPCAGAWMQEERIHELVFAADGRFSVTFKPFCTYKDYWGRYSYDLPNGRITMKIEGGSAVPDDFDGEGIAMYQAGERTADGRETLDRLTLDGVWLGKGNSERTEKACKSAFGRIASGDVEAP